MKSNWEVWWPAVRGDAKATLGERESCLRLGARVDRVWAWAGRLRSGCAGGGILGFGDARVDCFFWWVLLVFRVRKPWAFALLELSLIHI